MKPGWVLTLMVSLSCLWLGAAALYSDSQAQTNPDLTIFYTNDAWGYIEPCG